MTNKKGQGAIEYLLIIGAAILVVAVVIVAITGVLGAGKANANDSVILDEQIAMRLGSGLGNTQTETLETNSNYKSILLEGPIYINSNTIAQNQEDLKNAFSAGMFIIKINGENIKNLGYTYSTTTINPNDINKLHIKYNNHSFTLQIATVISGKVISISYIDYPISGTNGNYATGYFIPIEDKPYKIKTIEGKILLKRN